MALSSNDLAQTLADRVAEAAQSGTALQIRGSGSKDFLGRSPRGEMLSTAEHQGISNYEPRELVITVRTGTRLVELQSELAAAGQMLPFEPPAFGPDATLGGTMAAGLSGPRRPYAGSARDYVLGVTLINGQGQVLRFGGEVMKNVAGYDLSRLQVGAMGTLGVLLDVSMKVLPLPAHEVTLVQELSEAEAIARMNQLAGQPVPLSAACYDGLNLRLRLSGSEAGVQAAIKRLGGEVDREGGAFWSGLREQTLPFFDATGPLWRLSLAATTGPLALPGKQLIDWGGAQRWLITDAPEDRLRQAAVRHGGHAHCFRGGDREGRHLSSAACAGAGAAPAVEAIAGSQGHPQSRPSLLGALMQTSLLPTYLSTPQGQEADQILRNCVHCGFCTATCPTYQLLGDELDSPRGRIYLIKQVLEGRPVTERTQQHLDRCLTCRSCETTCPSGVAYGRLLDIGRGVVERQVGRGVVAKAVRWGLRQVLPYPKRFGFLLGLGQRLRGLMPAGLAEKVPPKAMATTRPVRRSRSQGAVAGRLCPIGCYARHQRCHGARAGPTGYQRHLPAGTGLLWRRQPASGRRVGSSWFYPQQHRRLVAAHRSRRRSCTDHRQWLWCAGERVRRTDAARSGLRRQGGTGRRAGLRPGGVAGQRAP